MIIARDRQAFTLIELLISIAIFTAVVMIVGGFMVDTFRLYSRTSTEQVLYEDSRYLLERIAMLIKENAIDYEEYHNRLISIGNYGENFGWYQMNFYNPGSDNQYGSACNTAADYSERSIDSGNEGCTLDRTTVDQNTGVNPYVGCTNGGAPCADRNAFGNESGRDQAELYLISPTGEKKIIISSEKIGEYDFDGAIGNEPVYAVSMVELLGADDGHPCDGSGSCGYGAGDGVYDTFDFCNVAGGYYCYNTANGDDLHDDLTPDDLSEWSDGEELNNFFVPISPLRVHIADLKFDISPVEDPLRAFAEEDPKIHAQPEVTIRMKLRPNPLHGSDDAAKFEITVQKTVASGVSTAVPAPLKDGTMP